MILYPFVFPLFFPRYSPPPVSINSFFDNLNEIFQPHMSFEKLAEKFLPEIEKMFENCHQENEHSDVVSYVVRLKIYKVSQSGKKFYLILTISDETDQGRSWIQESPKRSGRYWLDSASWATLQEEKEKILIEKKISVEKSSEKKSETLADENAFVPEEPKFFIF